MTRRRLLALRLLGCALMMLLLSAGPLEAASGTVHAVLFYSPTCGHCHTVITEVLPPLLEKYGDQLQIMGVDISQPGSEALFNAAIEQYDVPPENQGVPMLLVGDVVLVGSAEIPERFPGLIEEHLAAGGLDWPDVPGLAAVIAQAEAAASAPEDAQSAGEDVAAGASEDAQSAGEDVAAGASEDAQSAGESGASDAVTGALPTGLQTEPQTVGARLARDPVGNGLAVLFLIGMVGALGWVLATTRPWTAPLVARSSERPASWRDWAVPALTLIGLGVAGYLAYVETQQVTAICGPVGDCNAVQQSPYARLFGLIPIGVLGLAGYLLILGGWLVYRYTAGAAARWAGLLICALTIGGVLFSIYLTFLEPFVIGATCAWCLTSALLMTLLLLSICPYVLRGRGGAEEQRGGGAEGTGFTRRTGLS